MRIMDLGYYGVEDDYPNLNFMLPYKKGKGGTLTDTEKKFNKMLSRMRIAVEHVICRMKKYKIFGLRYRNRLRHYDLMTSIVSGLMNMKIIEINI